MRAYAALAAILAFTPGAFAATDERCSIPASIAQPQASLPRASFAVKRTQRLEVLFVSGSPSQTGAAKGLRSYPSTFEKALSERLPGVEIRITVRAAPRRTMIDLQPQLPAILAETKPNLVILQGGTVEAIRGLDPDNFGRALQANVSTLIQGGADVVLVDMQYSPRTSMLIDNAAYIENMRWVSETLDIPLFNRYEIMRHWSDSGTFDFSALKDEGLYEQVHLCLGQLLADFVVRAASLSDFKGFGR